MKYTSLFVVAMFASIAWSQDYHHWSEHFGARASLLGGAATSGLGDNATVFYNPAAMAFVEDPSISVSVNAYRIRMLKIENALGEGFDLDETQFSTMPNLIAGVKSFDKRKKLRLGYSILTRRSFNQKFDFLDESDVELIDTLVGPERLVNSYNLHHQLMEYWAGIAISYQLSKNFSIGLAHYGIYRDVKYSNSTSLSILPKDYSFLEVYEYRNVQSFNYYNVKGVFKPSIALNLENFRFGIAFTTPSFNMFGRGKSYRNISYINFADITDALDVDVQIVDRVDNIKVRHKEQGSLAFGVSWKLGKKGWLHFSNETFFGGKKYYIFRVNQKPSVYPDVFTEEQLESILLGNQEFLSLTEETEARTNIGVGLELALSNRLGIYSGIRTDFLYNEIPETYANVMYIESSKWNLMHFSLGLVHLTKKGKRYTAGIEYGAAPRNFINYDVDNAIRTTSNSVKLLFEIEVGQNSINQ